MSAIAWNEPCDGEVGMAYRKDCTRGPRAWRATRRLSHTETQLHIMGLETLVLRASDVKQDSIASLRAAVGMTGMAPCIPVEGGHEHRTVGVLLKGAPQLLLMSQSLCLRG